MMKCKHENKIYSPFGETLCTFPSYNVTHWVCKDCGYKGCDTKRNEAEVEMMKQMNEYEETKKTFDILGLVKKPKDNE